MNVLDENIPRSQRQLLEGWHVRVRQIGVNIGRSGMKDEEVISFLLRQRRATFFTRDEHFYDRRLCHANYGLVYLAVDKYESAILVRRLLRHPQFSVQAKRMGTVIRVSRVGLSVWDLHAEQERRVDWKAQGL